jgi:hypothetical protein
MRFFVPVYTAWGCKPQANSKSLLEEDCEDKGIGFWEGFSLLFIPPGVANPRLIVKVLWKRTVRINLWQDEKSTSKYYFAIYLC